MTGVRVGVRVLVGLRRLVAVRVAVEVGVRLGGGVAVTEGDGSPLTKVIGGGITVGVPAAEY